MSHQLSQILKLILCFTEQFRHVHLCSSGSSCLSWDQRMEQFLDKSSGSSFSILKKEPAVQNLLLPSLAVNRYKPSRRVCDASTGCCRLKRLAACFCIWKQPWEPELDVSQQHFFTKKSRTQFLSDSDKFNPLPKNGPFVHPKKINKCTLQIWAESFSFCQQIKKRRKCKHELCSETHWSVSPNTAYIDVS